MGAALTYARRYALFTLVGIAGEDDLDAPDLGAPAAKPSQDLGVSRRRANGGGHAVQPTGMPARRKKPSIADANPRLDEAQSVQLRDQLIAEIGRIGSGDEAAIWAQGKLGGSGSIGQLARVRSRDGAIGLLAPPNLAPANEPRRTGLPS
jgi:hypothetical protein